MAVVDTYTVRTRGIGLPDYAQPKPVSGVPVGPVHTSTDIAELAARQGSHNTFDRRGNVLWMDGFENGIKNWVIDVGLGEVSWDTAFVRNGGFSIKVDSTGGPQRIMRYMAFPFLSRMGFEFSFHPENTPGATIELSIILRKDLLVQQAAIRSDMSTWEYQDSAGWHDLSPVVPTTHASNLFATVKMVADFATSEYIRLIVNDTTFILAGKPIISALGILMCDPRMEIRLEVSGEIIWIDDFIVTINEPPNVAE